MMEDDSNQDSDDLDDDVHVPTTTATPTVEMDGEGGENAAADAIMNKGVKTSLFRQNTHPAHVTMGRVGLRPLHVPIGVGGFGFGFVLLLCFLVVSFHP